jgi:GT2 family glycosyltransferase
MQMKLSVIIVNYNVQYFLEQALLSVRKAAQKVPTEVFVVDNNSVDDSVQMVREKFPEVHLIANKENVGFSTANNQAIKIAKGEYVLLLNPDTIVREDTFEKTVAFMDAHADAGGLGVKMIDGKGNFLPESKRGFPSPEVAFYKTFGFSKLFPKSKRFNKYHLGYLSEEETHEVDVLSGAFMMLRKTVLDEIGLLDEAFFMYGEDIDLSYRVVKAGYKNYYFADTTIIHYKGESTKKGSLNYVRTFYNAMIIFARKHFGGSKAGMFVAMLKAAIYFRAALTLVSNQAKRWFWPVLDGAVIFLGLYFIKDIWAQLRFHDINYFKPSLLYFNFPLYIFIWLTAIYLRGGYDRSGRVKHLVIGICLGALAIAAVYGFLPSHLRSSRMLIIFGTIWAILSTLSTRSIWSFLRKGTFRIDEPQEHNLVIVGDLDESERVMKMLYNAEVKVNFIGTVSPYLEDEDLQSFIGDCYQLQEIVEIYGVNEIIFCARDISAEQIIYWMSKLGPEINYKTVPEKGLSIIGSNSKNTAGDLYTIDISFNISSSIQARNKRVLDIALSLLLFVLSPVLVFFLGFSLWSNIFLVLFGRKTWVGYCPEDIQLNNLPKLKKGVLCPTDALAFQPDSPHTLHRLNLFYAKDYKTSKDWDIIWKAWKKLGRKGIPEIEKSEKKTENDKLKSVNL